MAETIRGMNVTIKTGVGGDVLGGQRGATLNRSAELIDVTNKATGDGWKSSISGFKEWSVDCDGILVLDDTALAAIEAAFASGTAVIVEISDDSSWGWTGSAYITDFPVEAPYDDASTYSMTLQGDGALTAYSAATARTEANKIVAATFGTVNVNDNLLTAASGAVGAGYTVAVLASDGTKILKTGIAGATGAGVIQFRVTKTADDTTADTALFEFTVEA
jgi:TP901-1 family phage major tail protein